MIIDGEHKISKNNMENPRYTVKGKVKEKKEDQNVHDDTIKILNSIGQSISDAKTDYEYKRMGQVCL